MLISSYALSHIGMFSAPYLCTHFSDEVSLKPAYPAPLQSNSQAVGGPMGEIVTSRAL